MVFDSYSHGLEHLCGADNGLAGNVALCNHHFLGQKHGRARDLDTKVTSSHHHAVSLGQDIVKVLNALKMPREGKKSEELDQGGRGKDDDVNCCHGFRRWATRIHALAAFRRSAL